MSSENHNAMFDQGALALLVPFISFVPTKITYNMARKSVRQPSAGRVLCGQRAAVRRACTVSGGYWVCFVAEVSRIIIRTKE